MAQSIITLLTDFGLLDSYVSIMKGVMLQINSDIKFVDITHEIPQGKIKLAAFRLFTAYKYFPKQTIHLVVVDPSVGSEINPIIVETPDYYFVGPDNGIFSWIYANKKFKVYKIDINKLNTDSKQQTISNTFHGRDIFAPIAAQLSLGIKPSALGKQLIKWVSFEIPTSTSQLTSYNSQVIRGEVIDIDKFGNLITNISKSDFPSYEFKIKIGNHTIQKLKTSYEGTSPIAIFGSSGFLEISLPNGNCANFLSAKQETKITITSSMTKCNALI